MNLTTFPILGSGKPSKPVRIAGLTVLLALGCYTLFLLYSHNYHESLRGALHHLGSNIGLAGDETNQQQQQEDSSTSAIPKKLWYKLGPKGLGNDTREWTATCIEQNPDYEVEFMTEESADTYVQTTFNESDPELVQVYLDLSVPILKADLLRYLLLYSEGGVYCDLDVSCHSPVDQWIPPEYEATTAANNASVSMVVGWEFDVGWGEDIIREFATWTILSKPRSPHMWAVVQDILQFFKRIAEDKGVPVAQLTLDMVGDVVDATGPRRFTNSVFRSLGEAGFANATVKDMKNLYEPRMAGDVLVLPGWAFAESANQYPEGMDVPSPLVTHHYAGSWKNDKGGE